MAQNRPYQGYPYVNPVVIDVPSLDPATAARWTNLPRRPIGGPARNPEPSAKSGSSRESEQDELNVTYLQKKSSNHKQFNTQTSKTNADQPEAGNSKLDGNSNESVPIVYIDIPDTSASSIIESTRNQSGETEETFVQDTILYDPFKDRRIELPATGDDSGSEDVESISTNRYDQRPWQPPSTLQLTSPGSSSGYTTSQTFGTSANPNLPAFMSKEARYYGRQPTPDDGFPLAPIPVTDFPEPPPAYTEFDRVNQTNNEQAAPPRTEVVTTVTDPSSTIRPGSDRKLLQCQHCGQRVHSLVVKESGVFTHLIAVLFAILCLIPVVILIYCTDSFKYKNHYCPNCNQLIGYEIPILCQQMAFV